MDGRMGLHYDRAAMGPENRDIFAALRPLFEQLSGPEIERAIHAASLQYERPHPLYIHSQQGHKDDAMNALVVAFDRETQKSPEKARLTLKSLAEHLSDVVGEGDVLAALAARGWVLEDGNYDRMGANVIPDAAQLGLARMPPTVEVRKVTAELDAVLTRGFSDPDAVPVAEVQNVHNASTARLIELRDTLGGLRGHDAPEIEGRGNTKEVPLSEEDLELLRAVVEASLALHRAPTIPKRAAEALKSLYELLCDFGRWIDELSSRVKSVEVLMVQINSAIRTLKELLVALGVL